MMLVKGNSAKTLSKITKSDLLLLADVISDWTTTTLQVIEFNEFSDALEKYNKSRLTLIINIENQWNPVVIDEKCIYLAYTNVTKGILINQVQKFSSKNIQSIRMKKNNGISALIIAKIINDFVENSQTTSVKIKSTVIMKFVTPDLIKYIENSLNTFRRMRNQFNVIPESSFETNTAKSEKKRASSELDSESAQVSAKVSKPSSDNVNVCFIVPDDSSKVIIRNTDPTTKDLKDSFRKCINASIGMIEENGIVPRLADLSCVPGGCLILTCEDAVSVQWLMQEVPKIKSNDMKLIILPVICNTVIPVSEVNNFEEAFNLLKRQNRGLNTDLWYVLWYNKSVSNNFSVSVAMDESSARALCNLKWRAKLGFTYIEFTIDSNSSSVVEMITVETLSEHPTISTHNESISSCTKHAAIAVRTSAPQEGSPPQLETSELSKTLAVTGCVETTNVNHANLDLPETKAIYSSKENLSQKTNEMITTKAHEQALCSQEQFKTPQNESVSSCTISVQDVITPTVTTARQLDSGSESTDANNISTFSGKGDDQTHLKQNKLPVKLKIPKVLRTALSSTSALEERSKQASQFEFQIGKSQKETYSPKLELSQQASVTTGILVQQGHSDSRAKMSMAKNTSRRDNKPSQEDCAYLNPLSLVKTSGAQPKHCNLSQSTFTFTTSTERSRQDEQSSKLGSQIEISLQLPHSQSAPVPAELHAQQRHPEWSEVLDLPSRDSKMSHGGQAYLNPLCLEATSSIQPKHCKLPQSTITTAPAAKRIRQDVQSPKNRSENKVSSQWPHSQLAPVPARLNTHQRCSESQAEMRKVYAFTGRDNKMFQEGRSYINPLSLDTSIGQHNNYCASSQFALTTTATTVESRAGRSEMMIYLSPENDNTMKRIYREMHKMHYGTDQPES